MNYIKYTLKSIFNIAKKKDGDKNEMKNENPAHFELVKKQNSRVVRNLLKKTGALSVSKIAELAGLTYPTVLALLKELADMGEVKISKETKSFGGRPGIQYELHAEYQYALVMYFDDCSLRGEVYDARGNSVNVVYTDTMTKEIEVLDIVRFVQEIKEQYPRLSAVALGVPGAVCETEITYLPKFPNLQGEKLAETIKNELGLMVFIENDMNAIAFSESTDWKDFAHLVYADEDCCIGVGIVMQGEVIKGSHGYAGELEYLCTDMKNQKDTFVTSIAVLTCVLDLPDILLSGKCCTQQNVQEIIEELRTRIPEERIPKLHIVKELDGKYEAGLLKRVLEYWEKVL